MKFHGVMLACDMDGTLLTSERTISDKDEQALRYFAANGGLFSLATGRAPDAAIPYFNQLPINAPYSLLNGSLICSPENKVLSCAGMPKQTPALIQRIIDQFPEIGCEIFVGSQIWIRQMGNITQWHMEKLKLSYTMVSQQQLLHLPDWCKINFTGEPDVMAQVATAVEDFGPQFCVASSLPSFCEVTKAGVHKAAALQEIATQCNITPDNLFAIGDSRNDEMMLRLARNFVPANAEPAILAIADQQVCSNDDGAVAAAIAWLDQIYQ